MYERRCLHWKRNRARLKTLSQATDSVARHRRYILLPRFGRERTPLPDQPIERPDRIVIQPHCPVELGPPGTTLDHLVDVGLGLWLEAWRARIDNCYTSKLNCVY